MNAISSPFGAQTGVAYLPFPNEIDLNEIFPDEDKNLNDLFQDEETKVLLKKMQKNKKDLHTMTDRFLDEDWSIPESSGNDPSANEDSAKSREATENP